MEPCTRYVEAGSKCAACGVSIDDRTLCATGSNSTSNLIQGFEVGRMVRSTVDDPAYLGMIAKDNQIASDQTGRQYKNNNE
jgi:hypothetical protein